MIDFAKFLQPMVSQADKSRQGANALATMMGGTVPPDSITVRGPKAKPTAPADPFGEFMTTLMGGKPANGFQNNGVQSFADGLRKVMIGGSDASELDAYRNDKITANNNSQGKLQASGERLQKADGMEFDDRQALLDPEYNQQYNTAREGTQKYNKAEALREAVATGDINAVRMVDPKVADEMDKAKADRETARTAAVSNLSQAANALAQERGIPYQEAFGMMAANAPPGLVTPQDMENAGQGFAAQSRMLSGVPKVQQIVADENNQYTGLTDTGEQINYGVGARVDPNEALQGDYLRSQIAKNYADAKAENGGDGSLFQGSLAAMGGILGEIAADDKQLYATATGGIPGNAGAVLATEIPIISGAAQAIFAPAAEKKREDLNSAVKGVVIGVMSLPGMSAQIANSNVERQGIIDSVMGGRTLESKISALYRNVELFSPVETGERQMAIAQLNNTFPQKLIPQKYRGTNSMQRNVNSAQAAGSGVRLPGLDDAESARYRELLAKRGQ